MVKVSCSTPLSLDDIVGQQRAKQFIHRCFSSHRLAHAYLFKGPDGVGKQLLARFFAARLNCDNPADLKCCMVCNSCRKYLSGNHPDFIVVAPESGTIKIDRVRELCRSLSYPPYEAKMRVVIMEDVHTMRAEAANALLKTLEEPPDNNVLILTTEASKSILPTIVSRCQVVPFFNLSQEQTIQVLHETETDLTDVEADLLARLAEGSPGQALLIRQKGVVEIWSEVTNTIERASNSNSETVIKLLGLAEKLAELKENLVPLLGLLRVWVRDLMLKGSRAAQGDHRIGVALLAAIDQAEEQLARNCNRALVCEILLFNLQSHAARLFF